MQNKLFRKGLVIGVVLLFLCLVYTPIINAETKYSLNMNTIKSVPFSLYIFIALGKFYVENETVKGHYYIMFRFTIMGEMIPRILRDNDYVAGEDSIFIYSKHVIIGIGQYGW